MKTKLLIIVAALLAASVSFGRAFLVPLSKKVEASDLIARVEVVSIERLESSTNYHRIAKIKVTEEIKGSANGQLIDLEFDNGMGCPNALYWLGADCIVFAVKMENGHYYTYNTYYGQIYVNQLTMPSGEKLPFVNGVALDLGDETFIPLTSAIQKIKQTQTQTHSITASGSSE